MALPDSTYVSLTTFRRTGAPVATPVMAAPDGNSLVVWTRADSGKITRLRQTSRVTVAPCDLRGRVQGPATEGTGEVVDRTDWPQALAALARKYPVRARLSYATARVRARLTGTERNSIIRLREG